MRTRKPLFVLTGAIVAVVLNGCSGRSSVDIGKVEAAIRAADAQFGAAVGKKDVAAVLAFYAPDATVMPPDAPPAKGTDAIRGIWSEFLKAPGLALTISPEKIDVAASGDLAVDAGRAEMQMDSPQGRTKMDVKYVTVWRKTGEQWKLIYDMWSSVAPPTK